MPIDSQNLFVNFDLLVAYFLIEEAKIEADLKRRENEDAKNEKETDSTRPD